jgi:hypothetical protein
MLQAVSTISRAGQKFSPNRMGQVYVWESRSDCHILRSIAILALFRMTLLTYSPLSAHNNMFSLVRTITFVICHSGGHVSSFERSTKCYYHSRDLLSTTNLLTCICLIAIQRKVSLTIAWKKLFQLPISTTVAHLSISLHHKPFHSRIQHFTSLFFIFPLGFTPNYITFLLLYCHLSTTSSIQHCMITLFSFS